MCNSFSAIPLSARPPEDLLDSWKEIAAYLNRDVTTVQRWEKREGMPVHRHLHDKIGSVYASRTELDAWARSRKLESTRRAEAAVAGTPSVQAERASRVRWKPLFVVMGLQSRKLWTILVPAGVVVAALIVGGLYYRSHRVKSLTDKDTVVLADFSNSTGDPVFDDTLKQALAVQLGQSPFVHILSDARLRDTLKLMARSPEDRVDSETAREICERTGSAAVIAGSIAPLGNQYVIGLNAINCQTGDALARDQAQAPRKEQVLAAMDGAARKLRVQLGESLSSMQRFSTPLEQATTSSFEALKAYGLGLKIHQNKGDEEAIPLFQRAVELDSNFAIAYAALGTAYANVGEDELSSQNIRKAYSLRSRASEREKFRIASYYFALVTGNVEKRKENCQHWVLAYPRDWLANGHLADSLNDLGNPKAAAEKYQEVLQLNPDSPIVYGNLFLLDIGLGRLDEAETVLRNGEQRGDYRLLYFERYGLSFLRNDAAGMSKAVARVAGKAEMEDVMLGLEAQTEAYRGRVAKARELSRRAVASAQGVGQKGDASDIESEAALREALFGNVSEARRLATAALSLSDEWRVRYMAALALAVVGDTTLTETLAYQLAKRFPEGTVVQSLWLPTIHAQIALVHKQPEKAIEILQIAAVPYELFDDLQNGPNGLFSIYVRGNSYLRLQRGTEAAAEFQKILDHRGTVLNEPTGALARLGLGRSYALQGDKSKARVAYQDFLDLWRDADPDIPILRQAKAEYTKLE